MYDGSEVANKDYVDGRHVIHNINIYVSPWTDADTVIGDDCKVLVDSTLSGEIIDDVTAGKKVEILDGDGNYYYLNGELGGIYVFNSLSADRILAVSNNTENLGGYNFIYKYLGAVVHTTSDETISGNKTFTGTVTAVTQPNGDNSTKVATTAYVQNVTGDFVKHSNTTIEGHSASWDTTDSVTIEGIDMHIGSSTLSVPAGQGVTISATNTYPVYIVSSDQTEILSTGENGSVSWENHTGSTKQVYVTIDDDDRSSSYNFELYSIGYDNEVEYLEDMVGVEVFEFDNSNITWNDTSVSGYDTVKIANYDQGELFQSILEAVKKGKSVLLKYNDLHFNLIQADDTFLAFSLSALAFSNFQNKTISFAPSGEIILETSQISSDDLKSSIDKANSAVQDVTITQTSSTNAGTTIQVDNGTTYTIVSDTEPQGSDRAYKAPSWGAMENKMDENELVVSAALNDLNTRINDLNDEKQDTLVSGTDIKTINNQSILGSGNIDITSDLGDSLVAMFSKLDGITPVRTIEYDIASTTGQIIFSRANVTEDALLNTVTDTLIYSIEVTGNSDANIYAQYKVYAHFQPCPNRSPMTFIEHIHRNPAGTASLEGLKLLTYYYPKAINNGYPYICYITAPTAGSRHVKIRVYQDSSNVSWKNPAVPVAVTEGLYNTTYQTKGSEMTITAGGWITNGITQAATTTATVSTSLPKNFTANIFQAGEALTGGNLVYRALNDGKIYRVGTLTATINDVSTNLTLDPMFGVTRIINSRAINANIPASDLDYKRSINPSTPNNGSSFQIETGWVKGDTMYYKCTQSGSSLIPTGHITSTLSPSYAYFPIGVINTASSMDFDCIGHEFITLNASGKVTHVNGLEIAGGSGGGGSQDLSDYVKYSNTTSSTNNGSCSSSETVEDNAIYTSGSTHYIINPGYTISLDVQSDAYTTYVINNTSPKAILASGTGDIEWTNTTSSNIDVQVGSGNSGQNYIATIYLKGYTEEVGEIKEKLESINGVQILPLSIAIGFIAGSVDDDFAYLDELDFPSNYIQRITTQLDDILSFYHQSTNPLYIQLMDDITDFDNPVPNITSSSMYLGSDDFFISLGTGIIEFKKDNQRWQISKLEAIYNKIRINGSISNEYAPNESGIINLPLKTINNQQIFGSGNILTTNAPLLEKTYENYTCAANDTNKGYIYFMNVVPTSSNYFEPWYVHYILEITTSNQYCQGYYEIKAGFAGTTSNYRVFNRLYSTSYLPSYYHLMIWYNNATKYANKETNPVKFGERIYSGLAPTTLARTYNIKVIDMHNCTVTFPDNIETHESVYTDAKYGYTTTWNATSNGGLDNYDANTVPYQYYEHYPQYYIHDAQTPLYRYKICGFDDDNRLVPVTITNRTSPAASTLTPCKVPMTVSRGLVYYATTTNITDPTVLTANGVLFRGNEVGIEYFRYNFDTLPGNNQSVYLKGTYTISTDTFVLDDDYYVFVPTNVTSSSYSTYFTEGKYYWYIGRTGNYSTANYGGFNLDNPLYQYNGTKLVPITSIISTPLEVNFTVGDPITCDTPFATIYAAYQSGRPIHAYYDGGLGVIYSANSSNITFYHQLLASINYLTLSSTNEVTRLGGMLQEELVSGTNIKTINNQSILGSGNITIQGGGTGGDTNVIETVKVNGTALTPDSSKAVNITSIPSSIVTQDATHRFVSDTEKSTWNNKYSIPSGGIPMSDLAVDPITSVTMNGSVVQADAGGAINLGTVITSHQSIKTINNTTITGTGNVTIPTGDTNVIETIKVNNTALTPTSKAVNITVPTKLEDLGGSSTSIHVSQDAFDAKAAKATTLAGYGITDAKIANGVITLGSNSITPLTSHQSIKTINNTTITGTGNVTIATPGTLKTDNTTAQTTANNESLSGTVNLHKISKTGNYNDLIDKPTIPAAVTESTVSGWGFTKNAGTITSVTGSNGLTGSGSSGSVTISHAAPSTSPAKSTSAVYPITIDKYGHITAAGTAVTIPTQVTEQTVSGWGFTKNVGTVTSVEVNGTTASQDAGGCVSIDAITGIEYASHPITATNGVVDIQTAIQTEINAAKVTIYSGTTAPSNSQGTNGDLYLQTS